MTKFFKIPVRRYLIVVDKVSGFRFQFQIRNAAPAAMAHAIELYSDRFCAIAIPVPGVNIDAELDGVFECSSEVLTALDEIYSDTVLDTDLQHGQNR